MRIVRSIKKRIKNFYINRVVKQYKYVHLMYNDKFNKPFVDFLNRHFDSKEHLILCFRELEENIAPFPVGKNVIEIYRIWGINLDSPNIEKVFFHSLFGEMVEFLYSNKNVLRKSYWFMWGWDIYQAKRDQKNDYVRRNFAGYLTTTDKDYAIIKYGLQDKKFYECFYIFPISSGMLNNTYKLQSDKIRIQINNSSDKSTLEMLEILAKFKEKPIEIYVILSYGDLAYKDAIIKLGKKIFQYKFNVIDAYLSPVEYAQHLAQNDILILNQDRQQGFGNTLASLYLGVKVFIRQSVSVYGYLLQKGIQVYNSEAIAKMSYDEFVAFSYKDLNKHKVSPFFDEKFLANLYEKCFKDHL